MSTGADALLDALWEAGVDTVFGHPGGAMLPGYDALTRSPIRHVLARHEQGAGHMAEGFARVRGVPGVVLATSGPGATNLITPLADAHLDSVPLLVITAQVNSAGLGREAFQEVDVLALTAAVTKYGAAVLDPTRIRTAVHEALQRACAGRPGPVLLDIPKDVLAASVTSVGRLEVPVAQPRRPPAVAAADVRAIMSEVTAARRPVLYVGGGVAAAHAHCEMRRFAERWQIPVVTTLMARGQIPDAHPLNLGMPGMHGRYAATTALQRSDLIMAFGARFDDRVTGDIAGFAPLARVVHVDIDEVEIGKNRAADVGVVGDCRDVLDALLKSADGPPDADERRQWLAPWWEQLDSWRDGHPLLWEQSPDGPLKPQTVLRALDALRPRSSVVVTGVGQHQMWAAQHLALDGPRRWITSGGLGTMGFCLPAALGAKAAAPSTTVVGVDGDGSFQMTSQEMATASTEGLPVVCLVLNNGGLGMVRQWQDLFYDGRRSAVDMDPSVPDLMTLARAYGWVGLRCDRVDDLHQILADAFAVEDRPVLVEMVVDPAEMVFPMVPSGSSNDVVVESAAQLEGAGA